MRSRLAAVVAIGLTACHPLEDRVTAAFKNRLNDPLSLQLREVRRSPTSSSAVCGEFNSKNRMGGYVGFRQFALGPDDQLVLVEDDASPDDLSRYLEWCGTAEQRAERALRLAEAKALVSSKAAAPEAASTTTPMPDQSSDRPSFQPASPGSIELLQCHMDECSWSQLRSVTPVRNGSDSLLLKVVARRGSSSHDPNQDPEYPEAFDASVPIRWEPKPSVHYVLCSRQRPSSASPIDGKWYVDRLTVISPPGFQQASVQEYVNVCHGKRPGTWNDDTLKSLGYAELEGGQSTVPTEDAAVAMLR